MNDFSLAVRLDGRSKRFFVFADHASNKMPDEFGRLGVPDDILETHIAWDPGAGPLTRSLAEKLDAPGILCGFSRSLIDPNRSRDRADLVLETSDMIPIPGNQNLPIEERHHRIATFFDPYHERLDYEFELACANGVRPFVVAIHTFTRKLMGDAQDRPWHIGILWRDDEKSAQEVISVLRRDTNYLIGDNEPYDARVFNYSVDRHVAARHLRHVTFEIRQDLVGDEEGVETMASVLASALEKVA